MKAFKLLLSVDYDFSQSILLIRLHSVVQLFTNKFMILIAFCALEFHTSRRGQVHAVMSSYILVFFLSTTVSNGPTHPLQDSLL
jgi:hypothetical protein